jgi:hypothetical protein
MLSLQPHHITYLYVLVDDLLSSIPKPLGGRPTVLSNSEVITILLWNTLTVKQKTLKDIYTWVILYHTVDFPKIPHYRAFVYHCHRVLPLLLYLLEHVLHKTEAIRFVDSTMVEVCRLIRADSHKVAKSVAGFGKNHQGWHYGFKLHASVDARGGLCQATITPANVNDAQALPKLLNQHTRVAVGDGGYTAHVMAEHLFEQYGTIIVSPPHPKQKRKVMTWWQQVLLTMRPKVESVWDYLKEHLHLVTSFPRSVKGYLLHYVRILLGYQLMVI